MTRERALTLEFLADLQDGILSPLLGRAPRRFGDTALDRV